ncbi:MAG: Rieske (2Fe-2S) protein [Egibacteraceae bacterium]
MPQTDSEPVIEQLPNEVLRLEVRGNEFLIGAACPHRKGRLAYGYVNARTLRITCPLHQSTFDLQTGCPVSGPSNAPLRVRLLDDRVSCSAPGACSVEEAEDGRV